MCGRAQAISQIGVTWRPCSQSSQFFPPSSTGSPSFTQRRLVAGWRARLIFFPENTNAASIVANNGATHMKNMPCSFLYKGQAYHSNVKKPYILNEYMIKAWTAASEQQNAVPCADICFRNDPWKRRVNGDGGRVRPI